MPYTKRALIRDEGYPPGHPAPMHIDCECGSRIPVPAKEALSSECKLYVCPGASCGRVYDNRGWIIDLWRDV